MAVSYNSNFTNPGNSDNVTSYSISHTPASGTDMIVVLTAVNDNETDSVISGISSDVDGSFTKAIASTWHSYAGQCEVWYLTSPSIEAHTITVTPSGKCTDMTCVAVDIAGCDTSSPILYTATAYYSSQTTAPQIDCTANPSNHLFLAVIQHDSSSPGTADSPATDITSTDMGQISSIFSYTAPTSTSLVWSTGNGGATAAGIVIKPAATGPVGTLSQTLGAMTAAGSGDVDIAGTGSITLGAMTSAGSGGVDVVGIASNTLGTLTLTGSAALLAEGSASNSLGDLTLSGTGTVANPSATGALDQTLGAMTISGSGTVDIDGTASNTLGIMTASASGDVAVEGSLNETLGDLTLSASGSLSVTGTSSSSLGELSASSSGDISVTGNLSQSLGDLTLSGAGTVGNAPAIGTLDQTLGTLTGSSTGSVAISGSSGITLGALTVSGTGTVTSSSIEGTASIVLDGMTVSASSTVIVVGSSSIVLSDLTVTGSGSPYEALYLRLDSPDYIQNNLEIGGSALSQTSVGGSSQNNLEIGGSALSQTSVGGSSFSSME